MSASLVRFFALGLVVSSSLASGCVSGGGNPRGAASASPLKAVEQEPWADPGRTVAVVNGRVIDQGELYRRILRRLGTRQLILNVVAEEAARQEAERRGIRVTPDEVEHRLSQVLAEEEARAGGRENLVHQYERLGLTYEEARAEKAAGVELEALLSKLVRSLRDLNDEVLRAYYKMSYAQTRYAVRQIAYSFRPQAGQTESDVPRLKLEARNRAERAADRVRKGADFSAIARAESQDPITAPRGGELGEVFDDPRIPDFVRVVFKMAPNEVSDPIENPEGGFHVFQVTAVHPSESFVDCKEKMLQELRERDPTSEELGAALERLTRQSKVELFPGEGPGAGIAPAAASVGPSGAQEGSAPGNSAQDGGPRSGTARAEPVPATK